MIYKDVVVIGAGPAGLAAAAAAGAKGAGVLLLEREGRTGGVLNQCIHDGFGLVRYREQLGGPEYAERIRAEAENENVTVMTGVAVRSIEKTEAADDNKLSCNRFTVNCISRDGVLSVGTSAVVIATGCRERTRGMISIAGTRPAGIFTAGTAQNLINLKNVMVGRRVVVLGTGDIGLIMARRLTLEGAEVICAIEIKKDASGLSRNVRQCLDDFGIPVFLSHGIVEIIGKNRLEAVVTAALDDNGKPVDGTFRTIECDTLIVSAGLIPENEVAQTAGVDLDTSSNAIFTDSCLMSSVPGIFACGNCKGIMDLADFVSVEGRNAGTNAAAFALNEEMVPSDVEGVFDTRKGMPDPQAAICTGCPRGCEIVMNENGETAGAGCPKGEAFYMEEKENPSRILTTTVRIKGVSGETGEDGDIPGLLPVKSDRPVPIAELREIVKILGSITVESPVHAGQIIYKGAGTSQADIVAQCDM